MHAQSNNVTHLPPRQSPFLTTDAAADYLGVIGARTLERLRLTGGGPKYAKVGRKVVYRTEWLNDWLATRTFDHTAAARKAGIV